MYDYLIKLKDELNSHTFRYEDSCCVLFLIEYHTVEHCFAELRNKLNDEKEYYQNNYSKLYDIQSDISNLLLCEKQIAKNKTYCNRVYSNVVSTYEVNNELDILINMYK